MIINDVEQPLGAKAVEVFPVTSSPAEDGLHNSPSARAACRPLLIFPSSSPPPPVTSFLGRVAIELYFLFINIRWACHAAVRAPHLGSQPVEGYFMKDLSLRWLEVKPMLPLNSVCVYRNKICRPG